MKRPDRAPIRSALALLLISPAILAGIIWLIIVAAVLYSREKLGNWQRRNRIKELCQWRRR